LLFLRNLVPEKVENALFPEQKKMRKERNKKHREALFAMMKECFWNLE
jgi:hypothetical protein